MPICQGIIMIKQKEYANSLSGEDVMGLCLLKHLQSVNRIVAVNEYEKDE
jgi:hypothetical protein